MVFTKSTPYLLWEKFISIVYICRLYARVAACGCSPSPAIWRASRLDASTRAPFASYHTRTPPKKKALCRSQISSYWRRWSWSSKRSVFDVICHGARWWLHRHPFDLQRRTLKQRSIQKRENEKRCQSSVGEDLLDHGGRENSNTIRGPKEGEGAVVLGVRPCEDPPQSRCSASYSKWRSLTDDRCYVAGNVRERVIWKRMFFRMKN